MFTPPQYALLKAELQTDPAGLGYASLVQAKDWGGLASLLATVNLSWTCTQPQVPLTRLLQWYAGGPAQKIVDYANNASNNAALRSMCIAAQQTFNVAMPYFDLSSAAIQAFVSALVSGGVLSASDDTNLQALQTVSGVTRVQAVLNLPGAAATGWDVRYALKGR